MGGKLSKKKGYNVNDDKTKEQDAKAGEASGSDDNQVAENVKDETAPAAKDVTPTKEAAPAATAVAEELEKGTNAEPIADGEVTKTQEAAAEPTPKEAAAPAVKDEADAKKTEAPKAEADPKASETPKETPKESVAPEAPPKDSADAPNKDQSKDQSANAQD
ncbi:brain acid soluble protein 1 homolog [Syngnathus scovelli]|uniref:brain acid soluble protein 1 homolog n=1 Tax=Syngnathus scovelli TaxID=161590 RepID=UPI00210F84C6|nr:brain acid soluble protein 1 homolog [Syngnathus scovelli]